MNFFNQPLFADFFALASVGGGVFLWPTANVAARRAFTGSGSRALRVL